MPKRLSLRGDNLTDTGNALTIVPRVSGWPDPGEAEALALIAAGRSTQEEGQDRCLSVRSVERHVVNIYRSTLTIAARQRATRSGTGWSIHRRDESFEEILASSFAG